MMIQGEELQNDQSILVIFWWLFHHLRIFWLLIFSFDHAAYHFQSMTYQSQWNQLTSLILSHRHLLERTQVSCSYCLALIENRSHLALFTFNLWVIRVTPWEGCLPTISRFKIFQACKIIILGANNPVVLDSTGSTSPKEAATAVLFISRGQFVRVSWM